MLSFFLNALYIYYIHPMYSSYERGNSVISAVTLSILHRSLWQLTHSWSQPQVAIGGTAAFGPSALALALSPRDCCLL